jgi:hypothetical protein
VTDPRKVLPDKIVLAMSKSVGSSMRRGFLRWKSVIADRKALRLKALKLTRRACYHMKYGAAFKAMASFKLNAKLKQAARAQRETRGQDQEASAARTRADVAPGGGRHFAGREGDRERVREGGMEGGGGRGRWNPHYESTFSLNQFAAAPSASAPQGSERGATSASTVPHAFSSSGESNSEESSEDKEAEETAEADEELVVGQVVRLCGLQRAHELNGSKARVLKVETSAQSQMSVLVSLLTPTTEGPEGRQLKVPRENLISEDRLREIKRHTAYTRELREAAQAQMHQARKAWVARGGQDDIGADSGEERDEHRDSSSLSWLLTVFKELDRNRRGKIGHPEMAQFIKKHPKTALRLGFPDFGPDGVPLNPNHPLRLAYLKKFVEMTVSDRSCITREEFLGVFGHGELASEEKRLARARAEENKIRSWYRDMAQGMEGITKRRMHIFISQDRVRAQTMGFSSTSGEGVERIFNNMDLSANGSLSEDEFLGYFGYGPLGDAKNKAQVQAMKDAHLQRLQEVKPQKEYKSTYLQQQLRKDGHRKMDGKGNLTPAWKGRGAMQFGAVGREGPE